jgi:hypothetical protein
MKFYFLDFFLGGWLCREGSAWDEQSSGVTVDGRHPRRASIHQEGVLQECSHDDLNVATFSSTEVVVDPEWSCDGFWGWAQAVADMRKLYIGDMGIRPGRSGYF